jgi:branched-chain amino acid transport system substrate-binding protein
MTAMLGAFCSSASMSIATQANIANFFQISYASTNEALSNVNQYRYFTRTAPSDAIQGPLLAKSLILLGITPYIAVVHLVDSYSSSLAKQIILKYEETDQYTVLMTYSFDSAGKTDADYDDIVFRIGESGCGKLDSFYYYFSLSNPLSWFIFY